MPIRRAFNIRLGLTLAIAAAVAAASGLVPGFELRAMASKKPRPAAAAARPAVGDVVWFTENDTEQTWKVAQILPGGGGLLLLRGEDEAMVDIADVRPAK